MTFAIKKLLPLAIRLDRVGPFQHEIPLEIEFVDAAGQPSNLFLLVSRNGMGKTTILEAMSWLFGLIESDHTGSALDGLGTLAPIALPPWLMDCPEARCQLDLFLEAALDGETFTGLVSVAFARTDAADGGAYVKLPGTDSYPELNTHKLLMRLSTVQERSALTYGSRNVASDLIPSALQQSLLQGFLETFSQARNRESFAELGQPSERAPTLLYFAANRDLAARVPDDERSIRKPAGWGYQSVRRFGPEQGWENTLEGLLVWLDYVDEHKGRFEQAREILHQHVFSPDDGKTLDRVERVSMAPMLRKNKQDHRFDRLSSGERNLAIIFLRLAAHMTTNAVVLIDEADLHLHPEWERGLTRSLKTLLRDWEDGGPSASIIFTCHSTEMIKMFDFHRTEPGLRKGMWIIEDEDFQSAPSAQRED